jgi:hypothetical protein
VQHPNPYPHHRSVWVADTVQLAGHPPTSFFMSLNSKDKKNPQAGFRDRVRHEKFVTQIAADDVAVIEEELLWEAEYGKVPVLDEDRALIFSPEEDGQKGEYELILTFGLTATYGDVKFLSDRTHYAWPYIRMAPAFSMDHGGTITSSAGVVRNEDIDAKGMYAKRANWVDYSNTVNGVTEGVAIFSEDKEPPRWFTRSYGTFGPRRPDQRSGVPFTLKKGDSLEQTVDILVHSGDVRSGRVAERYQQYVKRGSWESRNDLDTSTISAAFDHGRGCRRAAHVRRLTRLWRQRRNPPGRDRLRRPQRHAYRRVRPAEGRPHRGGL